MYFFHTILIVEEKPAFGLIISIVSGVGNMFLDFLFIYVFKWGVLGAALATRNKPISRRNNTISIFHKSKRH